MVNHNPSEETAKEFNKYADPDYVGKEYNPKRYKGKNVLALALVIALTIFGFTVIKKEFASRDQIPPSYILKTLSHPAKIDWLTSILVSQNLKVGTGAQVILIHLASLYDSFGSAPGTITFTRSSVTFSKMVNAKSSEVGSTNSLITGPGAYALNDSDQDLATGVRTGVKVSGYYQANPNMVKGSPGSKASKPTWCFTVENNGVSSRWTSKLNGMEYMQIGGAKALSCQQKTK